MEHFRSSGTSGGLIFARTASRYVKERAGELLRQVGVCDAEASAGGGVSEAACRELAARVAELVGPEWLERNAEAPAVRAFEAAHGAGGWVGTAEDFDALVSGVLRARFPEETARPEKSVRWG